MEALQPTSDEDVASRPVTLIPLNKRVRLLWWAQGALVTVQVTVLAVVVDVVAPLPLPNGLIPGAAFVVGAMLAAILPVLRYRRWRYAIRERDLWIRRGVFWVTVSVIPFSRLQFVDTQQGPLDRLFGLSQLVVHTAALGTSGQLPGLETGQAEQLRDRLAQVDVDVSGL
ncbi:MAG: PH domain-containing protein [Nitriliruptorales bacterium]|nr:PH domain-containing protein [Nitriliruptorales bacterium]